MSIIVQISVTLLLLASVHSLHISVERPKNNNEDQKSLRRVLQFLANFKSYLTSDKGHRKYIPNKSEDTKHLIDALNIIMKAEDSKEHLRDVVPTMKGYTEDFVNVRYEEQVEKELESIDTKHSSALLDKAYVEKKGRNDFLVVGQQLSDPFVTIIPNDIYYNIEKKCVNWLDDCSLQGIKARLLETVQSPYKK